MVLLWAVGSLALASSIVITTFGLAVAATPRFYHGMLTGIGIGAVLGLIVVYVRDVRAGD
jgi:hypothetical protein